MAAAYRGPDIPTPYYGGFQDSGTGVMAFKPNYRFERAERDRVKKAKKEEKLKKRQLRDPASPTDAAPGDPEKRDQPN